MSETLEEEKARLIETRADILNSATYGLFRLGSSFVKETERRIAEIEDILSRRQALNNATQFLDSRPDRPNQGDCYYDRELDRSLAFDNGEWVVLF